MKSRQPSFARPRLRGVDDSRPQPESRVLGMDVAVGVDALLAREQGRVAGDRPVALPDPRVAGEVEAPPLVAEVVRRHLDVPAVALLERGDEALDRLGVVERGRANAKLRRRRDHPARPATS